MRAAILSAAFALASCAPTANNAVDSDVAADGAGGFAAACRKTYSASMAAAFSGANAREGGAGARVAAAMVKARIPAMCRCAEDSLSETLDARGLAVAAELTPLRSAHDIAKAGGDAGVMRRSAEETRAAAAAMMSKYSLAPSEIEKIAAMTDMAIASCFAPGGRQK